MARHLLQHENEQVALIDTRGTFSPIGLRDVLIYQLRRLHDANEQHNSELEDQELVRRDQASDVDHGRQAIHMLERVQVTRVLDFTGMVEEVGEIAERLEEFDEIRVPAKILDSEDDGEDDNDNDDRPPGPRTKNSKKGRISMVIIDNIASVTSAIMETNQTQGMSPIS